jgi:UDP-N-acetyl-D-galactosamine dehydrogenase
LRNVRRLLLSSSSSSLSPSLSTSTSNFENEVISKWNFIKLKPGLVGGHCIPVDP